DLHMPGVNLMAVFENLSAGYREDLYIVTPNLDIMLLNTDPDDLSWSMVKSIPNDPLGLDFSNFQPLHGVCRIKYDSNHKRLYWLIKGRQENEQLPIASNCTGEFHYRAVYFVIYTVDNYGNLTEYYEFHDKTIFGDIPHYKDINICDFEFNRDDNNGSCDYFFLAKYNEIETWKFGDDPNTQPVEVVHLIHEEKVPENIYGYFDEPINEPKYYKFGRMLYIEELHKVVAFPYRYPGFSLNDPENHPPLIYVIDGFDPVNNVSTIEAPNQRIYDAVYISSTDHLVISYSADPLDKIDPENDPDSDIARSLYSGSSFSSFATLNPPLGIDVNSSIHLTNVNGQILISRKDEVLRLINTASSFSYNTILSAYNNFFGKGASGNSSQVGIIINRVGGKIENFLSNGVNVYHSSSLDNYYPVYHAVSNLMGTRVYFFNKLNYKKSGFYIYEPDETPPVLTHITNFSSPVGDCIYNPFRDEFLVSKNEDFGPATPASIVSYNSSNAIEVVIDLPLINGADEYHQNPSKMFIDPNGILYVLVNSAVDDLSINKYPFILTYDASTYEYINSYELNNFTANDINSTSEYYMAHFCYCKWNNTTYFTVTPQEISLPPYHSEYNTMTGPFPNSGYLYSINNGTLSVEAGGTSFIHPGKIICPDDGNDDYLSPNEGQLFFISDDLKTYLLDTKEIASGSKKVNDIVYSPYHDKVFAFAD
ncbi:MAG: hypothetical protein U9N53_12190, partial [Bacteroidota bacterium]|nr:hypothetical protein [Bacteroidota bacterium]